MNIKDGWCSLSGTTVSPSSLHMNYISSQIFVTAPEVELTNPDSLMNGCHYKLISVKQVFQYDSLQAIENDYANFIRKCSELSMDASEKQLYTSSFVVPDTSVILYGDSTQSKFTNKAIVYVDPTIRPSTIAITATYNGTEVPVGNKLNKEQIIVTGYYGDGTTFLIDKSKIDLNPSDLMITKSGDNVFQVSYVTEENLTLTCVVTIPGIKAITSIVAVYDGEKVTWEQSAKPENFVVTVYYSDGTSAISTDFSFPNGNIVTRQNNGQIQVYCKGYTCNVTVNTYEVASCVLSAYYSGPNVEVGRSILTSYYKIRAHYIGEDGVSDFYEAINPADCIITPATIEHEGLNTITIVYNGTYGSVQTKVLVAGIKAETSLSYIECFYHGPAIYVGSTYDLRHIICYAHYTDGSIVNIASFGVNTNVITEVGENIIEVTYQDKLCRIRIQGKERDSTMEDGTRTLNHMKIHPNSIRRNHRYRGPMESEKMNQMFYNHYSDIQTLTQYMADAIRQVGELTTDFETLFVIRHNHLNL